MFTCLLKAQGSNFRINFIKALLNKHFLRIIAYIYIISSLFIFSLMN